MSLVRVSQVRVVIAQWMVEVWLIAEQMVEGSMETCQSFNC